MTDPTVPDELTDAATAQEQPPAENDPGWDRLLNYLVTARGFDFHGYKPTTLARRIRKRMASLEIESFAAYQDHLEVHPDEFGQSPVRIRDMFERVQAHDEIEGPVGEGQMLDIRYDGRGALV